MAEDRRHLTHRQGRTPGRSGEEIKQQEIDKDIVRRKKSSKLVWSLLGG